LAVAEDDDDDLGAAAMPSGFAGLPDMLRAGVFL